MRKLFCLFFLFVTVFFSLPVYADSLVSSEELHFQCMNCSYTSSVGAITWVNDNAKMTCPECGGRLGVFQGETFIAGGGETIRCLQEVKSEYGPAFQEVFKSITCDNGCEFDTAVDLEQFAPVYYCHPYSSWERGSNENQNKLIRRFCPKGKSMANLTAVHVEYLSLWMNNYPRKLLGWKRPADLFRAEFAALGIKIPA